MGADFLPKRRLGGYRKEEVDQLLEDREAMIRHAESMVQASEARVAQLEEELARLSANQIAPGERDMQAAALEAMAAEQARLDEEREALRSEREQLAAQVATVRQEGATLEKDLERVRQEREDLEAELAALRDAAAIRNDSATGLRKEAEDARAVAASLREDMARLTADHEEQARQIAAVREDASFFLQDEIQKVIGSARESARLMLDRTKSDTARQVAEADRWWREVQAEVGRFTTWRSQVEPMLQSLQVTVGDVRASVEDVVGRAHESLSSMSTALQSLDAGMDLLSLAFEQKPAHSPLIGGPEPTGHLSAAAGEDDDQSAADQRNVADERIEDSEVTKASPVAEGSPTVPEYFSIQP